MANKQKGMVTIMFDIRKFGASVARLRKAADLTQSELADRLDVTRQAVSRYERGEGFPDVSILVRLAEVLGTSLDALIGAGEPTCGELQILRGAAEGDATAHESTVADVVNLAPLLKPSLLGRLAESLAPHGIDISSLVSLAEYLADEDTVSVLGHAGEGQLDPVLLGKLMPLLDVHSRDQMFARILDGTLDWHLLELIGPYVSRSQIEAAVVYGALPWEALWIGHPEWRWSVFS